MGVSATGDQRCERALHVLHRPCQRLNVGHQVHPFQGQLPMTLGHVMPHLLHIVHEKHLGFAANGSVGLQKRALLVEGF